MIEPVEYEEHILKNRNVIHNDPLRSLIVFPYDDVSVSLASSDFLCLIEIIILEPEI